MKTKQIKKSREQYMHVVVKEWFEKRKDGVYMVWEFMDKTKLERLMPYDDIPVIEINWFEANSKE